MNTFSKVISCYLSQITFFTHVNFCFEMPHVRFHSVMMIANDTMTLEHSNFSIPPLHQCSCRVLPCITFGKGAFGVFSTIPIWISRRVDSFKAYPRSWFCSCSQIQIQKIPKHYSKNEGSLIKGKKCTQSNVLPAIDLPGPHRVMHCCS